MNAAEDLKTSEEAHEVLFFPQVGKLFVIGVQVSVTSDPWREPDVELQVAKLRRSVSISKLIAIGNFDICIDATETDDDKS